MLMLSKRAWLAATLASLAALTAGIVIATGNTAPRTAAPTAGGAGALAQGGGGECPPDDPSCFVEDDTDPPPQEPDPGGGNDNGGGAGACVWTGGSSGPITVADRTGGQSQLVLAAQRSVEVPCNHPEYGVWVGNCYYGNPPPLVEPPDDPPDGQTAEDGAWYYERCPINVEEFNGNLVFTFFAVIQWRWLENGELPVALPSPEEVALDWLASVELFGIEIVTAPPVTGAGLVTLPVWLGVSGTDNTWGLISDTHCLQGVCVSIAAQVVTVDWTMGDGAAFTCGRDDHDVWQPGMNYLAPPGCHHYYQRSSRDQPDGRYPITATSNWSVHWEAEASGAEGDLETTREASVSLQIDEIQVLTR